MRTRLSIFTLILLLALSLAACANIPTAAEQEAPLEGFANPEILVDTAWVEDHLDDPEVHLLDVSAALEDYDAGHLPGAIYVSWREDLTNPNDSVRGQILSQDDLSALMSRLGVENDDTVVFYDGTSSLFATRAYWALKYYQHPAVHVYDGGSKKWLADGKELSVESVLPTETSYTAGEADPAIRTTWDYVVEHTDDPSTLFCDTRGPEEYAGTDVRSERGGHVPGAINVEWSNAVNEDGTFREAADLADLYSKAGFTPDKEIITYCQTGVRGAHTWFVLRELLGYPNVRNYDGSWEEYGNNPDSVIEQ